MNSFFAVISDKSLWFSTIVIVVLFALVPLNIVSNTYIMGISILMILIIGILKKQIGHSFIVFAYSLMIPYGELGVGLGVARYFLYLFVVIIWIFFYFLYRKKIIYNFDKLVRIMIVLLIISIIFSFQNDNFLEFVNILYFIISTCVFMYVCFYDNINLIQAFCILDIIFYCTLFYVIEENIFKNSPYQTLYGNLSLDFQLRAKGLMGHPLLMSSFISFYQVSLLVRSMIFKKWDILNYSLVLPIILLSASKTLIVLYLFSWVLFIVVTKFYKKIGFYLLIVISFFVGMQVFPFLTSFFDSSIQRVVDSSANHRLASYSVSFQIFEENIFGIGTTQEVLQKEVSKGIYFINSNYDKFFLIFDNAYLTALASFGLLSLLFFYIYVEPFTFLLNSIRFYRNRLYMNAALMFFSNWFLQNFSFDSCYYFSVNAFYFMFIVLFLKESKKIV